VDLAGGAACQVAEFAVFETGLFSATFPAALCEPHEKLALPLSSLAGKWF